MSCKNFMNNFKVFLISLAIFNILYENTNYPNIRFLPHLNPYYYKIRRKLGGKNENN